jgi:RHS repeat-associated protein
VQFTTSNTIHFSPNYHATFIHALKFFKGIHEARLGSVGMIMPGRSFTSESYRYGFNGKEKDPEGMGGGGSTYDYGFRIYNPQLAKFLSVDPLFQSFPWFTPYQFAGNQPVWAIDLDGLEQFVVHTFEDKETEVKLDPNSDFGSTTLIIHRRGGISTRFFSAPMGKIALTDPNHFGYIKLQHNQNFTSKEVYIEANNMFKPIVQEFLDQKNSVLVNKDEYEKTVEIGDQHFKYLVEREVSGTIQKVIVKINLTIQAKNIESESVKNLLLYFKDNDLYNVKLEEITEDSFEGMININDQDNPNGISIYYDIEVDYNLTGENDTRKTLKITHEETGETITEMQ